MTAKIALSHADLQTLAEARRRVMAARGAVTITAEQIAAGHAPQLETMQDQSRNVIDLCSRRAGKSNGNVAVLALDAQAYPGETQLYFGPTKPAVRLSIWRKIWKPFCAKWKLCKPEDHNETMMVTTFPNGSIVAFTGTDDIRHVETYLGNKLRRAIIDEAQSQPDGVLTALVETILPPALSDDGGQMRLSGTIPEVPAGLFYRIWTDGQGWSKHTWSRFDNPHMGTREKQEADLAHYLKTTGKKEEDPTVQRDWRGKFVFSSTVTAYHYDQGRNGYVPARPDWLEELFDDPVLKFAHWTQVGERGGARHGIMAATPLPGITMFSCAIDPGSADRFSLQVWGWGEGSREVQHVFEWASPRDARLNWSDIAAIGAYVQARYAPDFWFYDAGSSQNELDTFTVDYGIPVIKAAMKTDLRGQIRRNNDLLSKGLAKVMIGSALEEDYQKAKRDPNQPASAAWKWSSQWHPDPSEAGRYALQGYYEVYQPPKEVDPHAEPEREALLERLQAKASKTWVEQLEEAEENDPFAALMND